MNLDDIRDDDGQLPRYSWPGAYSMFYVTEQGLVVCPDCANDPDTSDPVVAYDVNWEDPALFCEDAGGRIESAYAEDDALQGTLAREAAARRRIEARA